MKKCVCLSLFQVESKRTDMIFLKWIVLRREGDRLSFKTTKEQHHVKTTHCYGKIH